MNILIVGNLEDPSVNDIVKCISKIDGISITVLTDRTEFDPIPALESKNIIEYEPQRAWSLNLFDPIETRRCKNLINQIDPDIMITFGASKLLFTSIVADFNPSIFIPQYGETARATGDYYKSEGLLRKLRYQTSYKWAFKKLIRHADEVWVPGPNAPIFERLGVDSEKIWEVDFTAVIDMDTYSRQNNSVNFGSGSPVIGTFRRPRGKQILDNYQTFLKSLSILKSKNVDFHAIIGGLYDNSTHRFEIQNMVDRLELNSNVKLLEMIKKSEMPQYLSGLDIYVNIPYPNYQLIGIGTTSKEAMACECAYISLETDTGNNPREWFINNSGALVNETDSIALADKLETLCKNESIMRKKGHEARKLVNDRYSKNNLGNIFEKRVKQYDFSTNNLK